MVMDKNYFLARLANGEDMNVIGQEMADMMNAAMAEHTAMVEAENAKRAAAQAEAEKVAYKRELVGEMIEIVQELASLEGFSGDEFEVTEEDVDQLVAAFTELFDAMREVKKLAAMFEKAPARANVKTMKSDEDVLAEFVKMFS